MMLSISVIRRNRYPAIYVASFVRGKKKGSEKMSTERFKNVTSCFVINLLNNKTTILLNLAEYRLILADSGYGLVGLSIR